MDPQSSDDRTAARRESDAPRSESPPRRDIRAEITAQREKIREDLHALRRELQILDLPEFVRQHPAATTAGASVLGFIASRLFFRRSASDRREAVDEELLDELLDTIIEDAAHRVAAGAETREALRTTLREHGPIVLEVERGEKADGRGLAESLLYAAFELSAPYLRGLVTGWLEEHLFPPGE